VDEEPLLIQRRSRRGIEIILRQLVVEDRVELDEAGEVDLPAAKAQEVLDPRRPG